MSASMYSRIKHYCSIKYEEYPPRLDEKAKENFLSKLKRFWFSLTLVYPKNPACLLYLRSDYAFRKEKSRHYHSPNYFIIHPLSKLSGIYNLFIFPFYLLTIGLKCMDVAFSRRSKLYTGNFNNIRIMILFVDFLSWLNVIFLCFQGIAIPKKREIILDFRKILLYRLTSFLFWIEIISSLPKYLFCSQQNVCIKPLWLAFNACFALKAILCYKAGSILKNNLDYLEIKSRPVNIILQLFYLLAVATHFMACLAFAVPRYKKSFTGQFHPESWILYQNLINKRLSLQYFHSFFKASAQTFGISINEYKDYVTWEETTTSLISYAAGKVIHVITWIAILNVLTAKNMQEIKFQEIIVQLRNFMDNKDLPSRFQERVVEYYNYYYQQRYFSVKQIDSLLPESLGLKVKTNLVETLKKSHLSLFGRLSHDVLYKVADHFICEVYSPNDVIVYAGIKGNNLFLLASGTVAIYSHSGKEVCHLHDGAYFGEISLVLKNQKCNATIVAIETSKIYKLPRKFFEKYLLSNNEIYDIFLKQAEGRLRDINQIDENYRRALFAQMY